MKYRTLGKTGLKVSEIGYGTWQLANDPGCWVGADLNESLKSLHRFVELGGNFIDTAWIYGYSDEHPDIHPSEGERNFYPTKDPSMKDANYLEP